MSITIFIDTNKYLDFYRASDHSLSTLKSLILLIKTEKVTLILPKQVSDEFYRDRDLIFKGFTEENFHTINTPGFMKGGDSKIEKINKLIKKLEVEYRDKFYDKESKVNKSIEVLFKNAQNVTETEEILKRAHYRTMRGNPPRKGNRSFGDAIIWESLLENCKGTEMIIISRDGDFASEINKNEVHPFLKKEWIDRGGKDIKLVNSLGEFINKNSGKVKPIKEEIIQEENFLNNSSSIFPLPMVRYPSTNNWTGLNPSGSISAVPAFGSGLNFAEPMVSFSAMNSSPNFFSVTGLNSRGKCICTGCDGDYGVLPTSVDYSNNGRCMKCRDWLSSPQTCSKCGKHYHVSYALGYSLGRNVCSDCILK